MLIWPDRHVPSPPVTLRKSIGGFAGSAHEISGFVRWLFRFERFSKHSS
jgi:hypothetical protein